MIVSRRLSPRKRGSNSSAAEDWFTSSFFTAGPRCFLLSSGDCFPPFKGWSVFWYQTEVNSTLAYFWQITWLFPWYHQRCRDRLWMDDLLFHVCPTMVAISSSTPHGDKTLPPYFDENHGRISALWVEQQENPINIYYFPWAGCLNQLMT